MIEVAKVNKIGNKIVNYTCKDTVLEAELSKKELVEFIKQGKVSNAYIQMYKGTTIVRVKDAKVNQILDKGTNNTVIGTKESDNSAKDTKIITIGALVKKEDTDSDEESMLETSDNNIKVELNNSVVEEDTEEEYLEDNSLESIFVDKESLLAWEDARLSPNGKIVYREEERNEKGIMKSISDLFKSL